MFYQYSTHKTRDAAEAALESYFADGEVSEGEHPRVRKLESGRWAVEFRDNSY